jgi:uncharacterized protein (TIGR00369 family)
MLRYVLPVAFGVIPTLVYRMIKSRLAEIIPLNIHLGIEVVSVGDGVAETRLPFRREITNHIGTVHATAIFGLAEAASGGAMSGALAPLALAIRPVAAGAIIKFSRIARTDLVARARTTQDSRKLREMLTSEGKVTFDVEVAITDLAGEDIGNVTVSWHVSLKA